MFSLDKFYNIIHNNLIAPLHHTGRSIYFYPFGTYETAVYLHDKFEAKTNNISVTELSAEKSMVHCYFFDQEPVYDYTLPVINNSMIVSADRSLHWPRFLGIFANSEHSDIKNLCLKENNLKDWYYFYHGFAALDWYRDFQYVRPNSINRFNKVFMCYNHLISKYRSYRLHLVSNLISKDLIKHGTVSLQLADADGTWQDTLADQYCPLDPRAKEHIYSTLKHVTAPLIADTESPTGALSANINLDNLGDALFHIVTETVYFLPKLHLTEKIFKPIVCKRPFILAAAPGNLAYLKGYGFKTFDRWIDESYDNETDNYLRIEMITKEIDRLCNLSPADLDNMYNEMQDILEYNHGHFYGEFKKIIVDEMVDNLDGILTQFNNGRMPGNHSKHHLRYEFAPGYLDKVKHLLLQ
jgi:hypothetical protein